MRIGILAPEYSSHHGGMQEHARQVIDRLGRSDTCTIYTRRGAPPVSADVAVVPVLEPNLRRAREALRAAESPDVWFALNAGCGALAPFLAAPMVTYIHGNDALSPWFGFEPRTVPLLARTRIGVWRLAGTMRTRAFRRDVRRGLRSAARLLANSANTAQLVRETVGGSLPPIGVVHPGVSDDFFGPLSAGAGTGPLRLLTVSRLATATIRKNVEGVLRAVASLPPELVGRYTIIGSGNDLERLQGVSHALGLGDRVRFLGALERDAVIAAYREADLFVMTSRASARDVEGFGIVYLEASAAGVPVLCSRAGGATEAVVDGENGLLIDGAEPDDIAGGIRAFFARRGEFHPARARAIAERFRWDAIVDRLRAELVDVVRQRAR